DFLLEQARGLFLFVRGDIEVGVGGEQLGAVGAEVALAVLLVEHEGLDSLAQLGDELDDVVSDLGFPVSLEPNRGQLALFGSEVEPGGTNLGAIEDEKLVALLELLAERGEDLADDAGRAGPDFMAVVEVCLDAAGNGHVAGELCDVRGLGGDLSSLPL